MNPSPCEVLILDCRTEEPEIQKWAAIAKAQYDAEKNFQDIFPWKKACKGPYIHFIAHTMRGKDPLVCGWLSLLVVPKPKYGSIVEISTRRIKDAYFGGVGQLLNNAVVQWATEKKLDFLQLWPLNDAVRAVYLKPEWGYKALRDDVKQLFRVLSKAPSKKYLDTLLEEEDMSGELGELEQALADFAEGNGELEPLVEEALEYLVEENAALEDFKNAVFVLVSINENDEEIDKDAEMETLLREFIAASTGASMEVERNANGK